MPTISRFFGILITMYFDDHDPPHFHARHADGAAKVRIDTLEVADSTRDSDIRPPSRGVERHPDELAEIGDEPAVVRHSRRSSPSGDRPDP